MPIQQTPFLQKMLQYSQDQERKIAELVDLVNTNQLTADEAAESLAGWEIKHNPQWTTQTTNANETLRQNAFESLMMVCHMNIDSRLPGWQGMIAGRHI